MDFSTELVNTNTLIREIIEEINNNYADEIAKEKLEIGAINGILATLDEYSTYISQDEFDTFTQLTRGTFLGIGVEIKQIREGIEISSIIDESPAAIAGLKISDVITNIDGRDVSDMNFKDIVSKLSSDSALKMKVSVTRNKTEKFDVTLKKSVIQLQSVKLYFRGDIAVIKITCFNDGTLVGVSQAIKTLHRKQSKGVILDLRNNPGGILTQAINVCDMFLANKKIVEFKSRNENESKIVFSDGKDLLDGLPMVVLIDSCTASGGELVAAALGENKRAILIGEKTYGKGSLQSVIPIPGKGAIKLTTAYLISPNGNAINQNGVPPDIEIIDGNQRPTDKQESDPIVLRAVDLIHGISALSELENKR
ncbi:MAG: S41 family peptidase [Holosporales bacterium]|nr:S41 family peptidase [Holosporales bacterium]